MDNLPFGPTSNPEKEGRIKKYPWALDWKIENNVLYIRLVDLEREEIEPWERMGTLKVPISKAVEEVERSFNRMVEAGVIEQWFRGLGIAG